MTSKPDIRSLVLELLKAPTDRDKQIKVGASNISQLCSRCLADDLLGIKHEQGFAWLGAVLGTALHNYLEHRAQKLHPEYLTEQRLILGDLKGYGTIKSTTDLYVPALKTAVDYKTTSKEKLKFIKGALSTEASEYEISKISEARYKTAGYLNQLMAYGMGLTLAGYVVEWVSLAFVCRDAVGDADVWAFTTEYDPEQAEVVWDRMVRLWAWLQAGNDPGDLTSDPRCWYCTNSR